MQEVSADGVGFGRVDDLCNEAAVRLLTSRSVRAGPTARNLHRISLVGLRAKRARKRGCKAMRYIRGLIAIAAMLVLGACATATVVPVGNTRPPIDPSQVRIYAQPPAHYEVLGILSGNSNFEGTSQGGVNDVIKKLKEEAAKLGANGVLLGKIGEQYRGSTGGASYLGWGTFLGSSNAAYSKTMDAQAIYVPSWPQGSGYVGATVENGIWPLPLPQFDIDASCQSAGGHVSQCIAAEQSARKWLAHHTTTVQIAGNCSAFAQQSYTMIQACVQQREGAH